MPSEMPPDDVIRPEPTPEQDLVMKVLIDSGISELESNLFLVEGNNVIAKESLLLRAEMLDDEESIKEIKEQIEANEKTLKIGREQLVELYKNLARTIDRKLAPALRQHLISGLPKILTSEERVEIMEILRNSR